MIVRVTRGKIRPNAEAEVFAILRDLSKGVRRPPGMVSLTFGRRMSPDGNELVSITTWTDMASLEAAMGTSLEVAAFAPQLQPLIVDGRVDHFETIVDAFEELETIGT